MKPSQTDLKPTLFPPHQPACWLHQEASGLNMAAGLPDLSLASSFPFSVSFHGLLGISLWLACFLLCKNPGKRSKIPKCHFIPKVPKNIYQIFSGSSSQKLLGEGRGKPGILNSYLDAVQSNHKIYEKIIIISIL